MEVDLKVGVGMPFLRVHEGNRELADRAYSLACLCHRDSARQYSPSQDLVIKHDPGTNLLWIALTSGNILPILQSLAQGRGKLVIRAFWFWPGLERLPDERRGEMLKQARRECEGRTAAGSPVISEPGSPGSAAGSAGSGDGNGGSGSGVGVDLGEPAVCARCERMEQRW